MLENLKKEVYDANIDLVRKGLVIYTWGNVSGIDETRSFVVIKPSGIPYNEMSAEDMVVVDLVSGKKIEGKWSPSSDTETHLELYRQFSKIGGITHCHSINAVAFAQAGKPICALGTTHADYFFGDIVCTRELTKDEIFGNYELNTGKVISETVNKIGADILNVPAILVKNHGPFSWGKDAKNSVMHAVVLEAVAEMNIKTLALNSDASMDGNICKKHYERKHGPNAYYGQKVNE
ncbi:MAG: L-ribulose-5-phosphate 4-epimerase AraD [Bacillota bacterium]